jgi:A1 cistron-splicing factor AAR2
MSADGGILFITDPPAELDFGIDTKSYTTGPNFRGVSLIPDGLHFCYSSSGMGARQGFFFYSKKNELLVRSWDANNEQILPHSKLSAEQTSALEEALRRGTLNPQLGPYPLEQHSHWRNLSNFISREVLQRAGCGPNCLLDPGEAPELEAEIRMQQDSQQGSSPRLQDLHCSAE